MPRWRAARPAPRVSATRLEWPWLKRSGMANRKAALLLLEASLDDSKWRLSRTNRTSR